MGGLVTDSSLKNLHQLMGESETLLGERQLWLAEDGGVEKPRKVESLKEKI